MKNPASGRSHAGRGRKLLMEGICEKVEAIVMERMNQAERTSQLINGRTG
jgi:hypothetical protein